MNLNHEQKVFIASMIIMVIVGVAFALWLASTG